MRFLAVEIADLIASLTSFQFSLREILSKNVKIVSAMNPPFNSLFVRFLGFVGVPLLLALATFNSLFVRFYK